MLTSLVNLLVSVITRMKTKIQVAVVVLLAMVAAVLFHQFYGDSYFSYAGTLDCFESNLSAEVSGKILTIAVREGDLVEKGAVLATIDDSELKIKMRKAEADYLRQVRLEKQGASTPDSLETAKQARDLLALNIERSTLRAPFSGLINTVYGRLGEFTQPGSPIVAMSNPKEELFAYFYVPHDIVGQLKIGQEVKATLPEMNNRVFRGRIIKINLRLKTYKRAKNARG